MEYTEGVRFDSLGLSPEIMRAIEKRNITVSTPVQAGCIPPMMDWQDVIAKAPTGTGKTFAYGIPIVEHVDPEDESVQAVILAPTRELAIQITDEIRDLAAFKPGVRTVCLYGGQPIGRQIDTLKKRPQIVVATPGRLSDHMKRRTVRVDTVQTVVLDEADRMLDMGFIHDVTRLLDKMANRKNLGLFSATISREVMDIAWVYQRDAAEITVREDEQNKPDIKQFRMDVSFNGKADAIVKILEETGFDRCMAFCNTKGSTGGSPSSCRCRALTLPASTVTSPRKSGRRSWSVSVRASSGYSSPPTWRPAASTWMTWTSCSTAMCPMKTRTTSTASVVPAGPSARVWR